MTCCIANTGGLCAGCAGALVGLMMNQPTNTIIIFGVLGFLVRRRWQCCYLRLSVLLLVLRAYLHSCTRTIPQVGLALTICVMEVLESSVSALFVCFAQVRCAPILFPLYACRLQFLRWGIRIPRTEGGLFVRCDGRNRRTQRLCSPHIPTCTRS